MSLVNSKGNIDFEELADMLKEKHNLTWHTLFDLGKKLLKAGKYGHASGMLFMAHEMCDDENKESLGFLARDVQSLIDLESGEWKGEAKSDIKERIDEINFAIGVRDPEEEKPLLKNLVHGFYQFRCPRCRAVNTKRKKELFFDPKSSSLLEFIKSYCYNCSDLDLDPDDPNILIRSSSFRYLMENALYPAWSMTYHPESDRVTCSLFVLDTKTGKGWAGIKGYSRNELLGLPTSRATFMVSMDMIETNIEKIKEWEAMPADDRTDMSTTDDFKRAMGLS